MPRFTKGALVLILLLLSIFFLSACQKDDPAGEEGTEGNSSVVQDPVQEEDPEPPAPPVNLVPYNGVVEHIFFHPVVAYPELAFDGDNQANGIDDWMVTAGEYVKILTALYNNGYVLVDINSVWSEQPNEAGEMRMVKNTLMLPEGKKPLIVSYDDVNYYPYMQENGFTYKLILGDDGELWSWGLDPAGNEVISQDLDAITLMEKFVREHPDFSFEGAMGCIGLTGFEGILGYRTQTDRDDLSQAYEANRQKEIKQAKPIVAKLKENGWTFSSHSWGHIRYADKGLSAIQDDTDRWLNEVGSLVGPTQVLLYPFGSRPDGQDVTQTGEALLFLQSKGFRIFASVGVESFSRVKSDISAVVCDRLHPDGTTLRWSRNRYLHLYDAWEIIDLENRPNRPYDRNP